ncbi:MAG: transpeptidase family protein [Bacteroidales bacterium]|nr:transpeptidase family protein [Candidatus Sodaliphilus fimicaballi]
MTKLTNNKRRIILRYLLVVGVILLFAGLIVWDMFKTTMIYAHDWNQKADSILTRVDTIEPERGKILADNGTVLAANLQFYIARVDWGHASIKEDTLKKYLPALCDSMAAFDNSRSAAEWQKELGEAYAKLTKKGSHLRAYRLIRRQLTFSERERIKKFPFFNNNKKYNGLYFEEQHKRSKPYGAMASRSIGNVGEQDTRKGLHGTSGLEMALDSLLYGIPGTATKLQLTSNIVNAEKVPAVKGYDITTTINVQLQDIVENELYAMCKETDSRWGTAILMEVATGEIKAISNLEWNDAFGDYVEGRNHAVLGYEPGSVMKPISMMMALEDGVVGDINTPMETGTQWKYGGRMIYDPHGGATLTPRQIIATSSNVGMSKIIVKKYGNNPGGFYDRLKGMGFFEPFYSGIGGEQQPIITRLGNTNADRVALTRMAFGYSTLIPPLCTLAMYNAIANDGKYVRPHLVKRLSREGEPDSIVPVTYIRQQVCSPQNAQNLRIMLHDVVWTDRGTAHRWLQDDNVEIAGKTGTAYTIQNGQYTSQRRLAFCGFFPYSNPKYSCMVLMMGSNRGAAASSGLVLKNIALKMYARGYLGDSPNYAIEVDAKGNTKQASVKKPVLYPSSAQKIMKSLSINQSHPVAQPAQPKEKGTVPNVKGMPVRDAIARLEAMGLNARFRGTGYVASQSIAPGTKIASGQVIDLVLHN